MQQYDIKTIETIQNEKIMSLSGVKGSKSFFETPFFFPYALLAKHFILSKAGN